MTTFTKLDSGLIVPVEKRAETQRISQVDMRAQYDALHSVCPKCGKGEIETTCMGYMITDLESFVDRNHARCCACAWSGIYHDLVPAKPTRTGLGCICWYCYWGWPRQVSDIYDRAVADMDGDESPMEFGPAHVVWSDENFGDGTIRSCIDDCDNPPAYITERFSTSDIARVRQSLMELLEVPESIRLCTPSEYDGEHPENFPPPAELEMVK